MGMEEFHRGAGALSENPSEVIFYQFWLGEEFGGQNDILTADLKGHIRLCEIGDRFPGGWGWRLGWLWDGWDWRGLGTLPKREQV